MGSVLNLPNVKKAISVARGVMERTTHSILTGENAGKFAASMGYETDPKKLRTPESDKKWQTWKENSCQPNYHRNVIPDPSTSCGPYKPTPGITDRFVKREGHDTIGMIAIDATGRMAVGTSTNGMIYKIPGRVADSAIPGSGGFLDKDIGAAVATGDGDVIVAYAASAVAVDRMKFSNMKPDEAAFASLSRLRSYGKPFSAALVSATADGKVGAAW